MDDKELKITINITKLLKEDIDVIIQSFGDGEFTMLIRNNRNYNQMKRFFNTRGLNNDILKIDYEQMIDYVMKEGE